jgi:NADH dehydrogenase
MPHGSGQLHAVTGAFSYTGSYIARRLLDLGHRVTTLTGHPDRPDPFDGRVQAAPYNFHRPDELAGSLRGATALFNTYLIRFPVGRLTYEKAVANSRILFEAARQAGVRRLVHISVTNPSEGSHLPYYRGKASVEQAVMQSGLSYAIVRPTLIFGLGDILINNIAWLLRNFPIFPIPGSGDYRLQPISAEDVAQVAVEAAQQEENLILDAAGPETYTFTEMVHLIRDAVVGRAHVVHLRPGLALALASLVGWLVVDELLTRDELDGLMANLLVSDSPPAGTKRLDEWLYEHANEVGARYASEMKRHFL